MSAVEIASPAARARSALLAELQGRQIEAVLDPGAFHPQPVGVLIGLPTLTGRGAYSRTYDVSVLCVAADPLNNEAVIDRLLALADECALALSTANYRPSRWSGGPNPDGLPALELTVTVTVTELED